MFINIPSHYSYNFFFHTFSKGAQTKQVLKFPSRCGGDEGLSSDGEEMFLHTELSEQLLERLCQNRTDLIKTANLKTAIIESECLIRFIKLIFEGPKYLIPLIEGVDIKSFSIFLNDPEKLFQVAFSLTIFSTVDFGKQVKFPNLIDLPVKVKVISLCN